MKPDPSRAGESAVRARPAVAEATAALRRDARTGTLLGVDFMPRFVAGAGSGGGMPCAPAGAAQRAEDGAAQPAPGRAAAGPAETPARARERAAKAAALEEIRRRYEADAPHARFITQFTNIVFGDGDPSARLMFIGEAPGAEEDRTGRPFVGRAGQLLNKMIEAMGLRREDVYIANVLKTRPPNNATPTTAEAEASKPYLFDQIAAVRPRVIVALGLPATRTVLGRDETMSMMRGRWFEFRHPDSLRHADVIVPVMPTFHPAFLLRSYTAENRKKVWSDLQLAMARLRELDGGASERTPAGPSSID